MKVYILSMLKQFGIFKSTEICLQTILKLCKSIQKSPDFDIMFNYIQGKSMHIIFASNLELNQSRYPEKKKVIIIASNG